MHGIAKDARIKENEGPYFFFYGKDHTFLASCIYTNWIFPRRVKDSVCQASHCILCEL